jgi:hypothetical protein
LYRCLHPVAYVTINSVYSTVNATFIPIFVFIYTTCFDHIGSSSGVLTLVLKMHYKTLTPSLLVSTCYSTSDYTSAPTQHKANNNIELAHERECQHRSTTTKNHTDPKLQITTKSAIGFNSDK